jgi:hypothetical protein
MNSDTNVPQNEKEKKKKKTGCWMRDGNGWY